MIIRIKAEEKTEEFRGVERIVDKGPFYEYITIITNNGCRTRLLKSSIHEIIIGGFMVDDEPEFWKTHNFPDGKIGNREKNRISRMVNPRTTE